MPKLYNYDEFDLTQQELDFIHKIEVDVMDDIIYELGIDTDLKGMSSAAIYDSYVGDYIVDNNGLYSLHGALEYIPVGYYDVVSIDDLIKTLKNKKSDGFTHIDSDQCLCKVKKTTATDRKQYIRTFDKMRKQSITYHGEAIAEDAEKKLEFHLKEAEKLKEKLAKL